MEDLPELAFEQVLSYLSLEDRLKARTVSRDWRKKFDFKVKSLCYSIHPSGFIFGKSRWASGAFAQNFISSTQFVLFFSTFGQSILSNLKHLRLCDIRLNVGRGTAFAQTLQSFGQLEELDFIRCSFSDSDPNPEFELILPMLRSIHLESFSLISRLTLDAPRLQKVKLCDCPSLMMDLVHVESVERVTIDEFAQMTVKNLKSLKHLYVRYPSSIDSTLLSGLEQLREIHLNHRDNVTEIFEQKQRYGRADLKFYHYGLLLNGQNDPETNARFSNFAPEMLVHWAESPSRLADEIPFYKALCYSAIERVAPELAINLVNRLTDVDAVYVEEPVQDVERFLAFLKNFSNISELRFYGDQPQDLFDRLPEHCTVQKLAIQRLPPNPEFLLRLRHLVEFYTGPIDVELVGRIIEELEFVFLFEFLYVNREVIIYIGEPFYVSFEGSGPRRISAFLPNLNAAIQFILKNAREFKSKTKSRNFFV